MKNISGIRTEYMLRELDEHEVHTDPIEQFKIWFHEAHQSKIEEVNAMTLATVDANHHPHARIVLLKGVDEQGFTFFTNYNSHKGQQLSDSHQVALVFFWKELERQVRIEGNAFRLTDAENDEYFLSRPEESRIGAWASPQSTVISNRAVLDQHVEEIKKRFEGKQVTRPPHWGGYRVEPTRIEFWQGRPGRLHDRVQYEKNRNVWEIHRLAP
ncbi:MAG TPA: pyridoxamine 5'-phosphate oxidase [Ferruginibacter sp.]|nr:pyridoxamine 5'-phosphate oxidase [Ferruginibacter sp.]HRO18471.1 pyridoxamine 5'-phosphate oxidase [Ferruginibacter sp.]HRQ21695.1 pyridoxamine 5'-phosphate oxidase [Ferruginibacter sp.]